MATTGIRLEDYKHSPVHFAIALGDHTTLSRLLTSLPTLPDPSQILSESDSLAQERIAEQISSLLDRRDVPNRETPLHLAVRLNDLFSARSLAAAGADVSLQNASGWNSLQEALCRRSSDIALSLLRHHHRSAWAKWRRRLPRLIAVLRRMRDFYMEISFHFESSIVPFVGKIAPSDSYRIWKRDANLRADTSLAGFDGLKIQRANQSFLFLGDGDRDHGLPSGTLLVLNRDDRKIFDAFETASVPMSESDVAGFCSQTSVYRPGVDVTRAELVGRTNWRKQERTESVGEWKAKVYEMHNVVFSFRTRKVVGDAAGDPPGGEQILPLELEEDAEDGFLVAEYPNFGLPPPSDRRRHSSFVREEREWVSLSRKSVDIPDRRRIPSVMPPPPNKEKEYIKSLRPSVWLTEKFPLKTEEILPLLDILAHKVKAVRRLRELLTTKFPPGTFPVKVAIPVVPTVRVVITFTKFVEMQPTEEFFTPASSPGQWVGEGRYSTSVSSSSSASSSSSSSSYSWLGRNNNAAQPATASKQRSCSAAQQLDPFAIPSDYTWTSMDDKSRKMKKSRSTKKAK
ncbi:ankyrin repeat domain-containing protein 13C-like [Telopea speciosissima]|uniref:ankyrin repeat domain-containing protein 13C-like n=1 Tax=Telopea speciosissima TaxID=54955 RepID=UPI001CC81531|nr:ankyrin repeat domain-containing protein 13C-like [Telopea speciosissima]